MKHARIHVLVAAARPTGGSGSDPDDMCSGRELPLWVQYLTTEDAAQEVITHLDPLLAEIAGACHCSGSVVKGIFTLGGLHRVHEINGVAGWSPSPLRRTQGCSH